jgi:hypothetical protein
MHQDQRSTKRDLPDIAYCDEKHRLTQAFLETSKELLTLQGQQSQAVIDGDADFARFDLLIHMAGEQKEWAKYALMSHIDSHGC